MPEIISKSTNDSAQQQHSDSDEQDIKTLVNDIESSSDDGLDSSDDENSPETKDDFSSNNPLILLKPKALDVLKKASLVTVKSNPGVVYLGRIPHGFYEEEMEAYFSQFGQVCRLRLARNKKTGKSKHYAFIEFASKDVATVVAETMDNYLLYNHQLKCKLLSTEQMHIDLFKGSNKKFKVIPWTKIAREKHNQVKTPEEYKKRISSLIDKEEKKRLKITELGIDYEFPGLKSLVEKS